jgi:small-conductance mechanosensitive channel
MEQQMVSDEESDARDVIFEKKEIDLDSTRSRLLSLVRILVWLTVVLIVLAVLGLFRAHITTTSVNRLEAKTAELESQTDVARDAAVAARDILTSALEEADQRREAGEIESPTAIRDALISIARIERHLCGGPCDEN